jgi:protein-serine/threonine kinase
MKLPCITSCDSFNRAYTLIDTSAYFTPYLSPKGNLKRTNNISKAGGDDLSNFTPKSNELPNLVTQDSEAMNTNLSLHSSPENTTYDSKNSSPYSNVSHYNIKKKEKSKFSNKEHNQPASNSTSQNKVREQLWKKRLRQGDLLLMAAENGEIERVKNLLNLETQEEFIPNINTQGLNGFTALHFAVNERHLDVASFLLEEGANVNAVTKGLRTPLHIACENGYVKMIELLIKSEANVNAQDDNGNTPGHILAGQGLYESILAYCKGNPDFTIKNKYAETPIEISANVITRNLIIQLSGLKYNKEGGYKRTVVDNMILHNNRADIVKNLLLKIKNMEQLNHNKEYIKNQGSSKKPSSRLRRKRIVEAAKKLSSISFESMANREVNRRCEVGLKDFDILQPLGEGTFGEVYLVRYKPTSKLYAMKVLNKKQFLKRNFMHYAETERNILYNARHPFIVSLDFAFQTADKLFLVIKYCPGYYFSSNL